MSGAIVHVAGSPVHVACRLRQRCAWCGALILDYDLTHLAVPLDQVDEHRPPPTWPIGDLVEVDGGMSFVVARDGTQLPPAACAFIDPTVTV